MDFLFEFFHGSYAYLLVLQVAVVCLLFFAFVWLMVQRMRQSRAELAPRAGAPSFDVTHWENKIAALEKENAELRPMRQEANTLREKVRYLETKLMEYEILQEEIGAISELKLENERIKKELVQAKPPAAILFDSTARKIEVEPNDSTQAGLENLLKKIDQMTEGSRKPTKS